MIYQKDQVQEILLSQRVTKNEIEPKMDGLEVNIEYLKKDMEVLKGGLAKLLQEMIPNGEKVVEETHDENKGNVNHDFIDSNVGLKTHNIPFIDMRNFDGKDPITWILYMKQYFDLHDVKLPQKVRITSLYS